VRIARRYLVPRALEDNGIEPRHLHMSPGALAAIAQNYTREAGVRNLERQIQRVARKVATRVARGKRVHLRLTEKNLSDYLGQPKVFREEREARDRVGVVTGLAWTPFGGEILFVEASLMPGRGSLTLTGQLGNVMRESAQAALSYVRSRAAAHGGNFAFDKWDIHIHVPSGAMPKDGPSAGVAMVTALASLVEDRPVRADTAMTGEISLRGNVLPVGGVLQKVLGARRAGIRRVVLPATNLPDLEEVPDPVREATEFVLAENLEAVLEAALRPRPAKRRVQRRARPRVLVPAKPRARRG
jgi:ATP-dependent Lon protease